jgi:hypothetical protein
MGLGEKELYVLELGRHYVSASGQIHVPTAFTCWERNLFGPHISVCDMDGTSRYEEKNPLESLRINLQSRIVARSFTDWATAICSLHKDESDKSKDNIYEELEKLFPNTQGPIQLKCSETKKWIEQFSSSEWFNINKDVAYKWIINCTNAAEWRNVGKYLYKIRCKWKNKLLTHDWMRGRGGVEL